MKARLSAPQSNEEAYEFIGSVMDLRDAADSIDEVKGSKLANMLTC